MKNSNNLTLLLVKTIESYTILTTFEYDISNKVSSYFCELSERLLSFIFS